MATSKRTKLLVERLNKENDELRNAARQLLAGLTEYSKSENWISQPGELGHSALNVWIGKGDGPSIARKYLGLDQDEN